MLLTCSRVECAIEFRARNAQKYCGKVCSGLAYRRPRGNCRICGKALIGPTQRVACSAKCAGTIGSIGTAHDQGVWGFGGTNSPDHLRVLWDEGHSTNEIGRRMGITKNAVVGKAHRLGLPARPSPIRGRLPGAHRPRIQRAPRVTLPMLVGSMGGPIIAAARKAPPQRAPEAPKPPTAPRQQPPTGERQCEWLSGDKPFVRCSDGAESGYPYCAAHCRVAYIGWRRDRQALACVAA